MAFFFFIASPPVSPSPHLPFALPERGNPLLLLAIPEYAPTLFMQSEETRRQRRRRKILYSRRLRKRMTQTESILWNALRDRRCAGLKFRRQVAIEWFIVDFLSVKHDLVVEIDGSIHACQRDYDRERDEVLCKRNLAVLRFTNAQILKDLSAVLHSISNACGTPLSRQIGGAGGERGWG